MNTTQHALTTESTLTADAHQDTRPGAIEHPDPPTGDPPRRHWVGWVLVAAALVAVAGLTVTLIGGDDPTEPRPAVGDAKDHPNYGQVTPVDVEVVGDAKDHPNYGQVTPVDD